MATLSVIRRWALREQMSIREIARRTGLSRNTVKKYLRAGEEEPRYAKRASSSKLDPYAEKLSTWLAIEATKSRKQRRNLRQIHTMEAQANEFASCLLMPKSHLTPMLGGSPEMARILALQQRCNVSKEAAARRYAELHGDNFAIIFSRDGKMLYSVRGGDFPWIEPRRGQDLFRDSLARTFSGDDGDISDQEESDPHWWLGDRDARSWQLWEEVLVQQNGYRITLLLGNRTDGDD